jgi:hypothetical protein
MAARRRKAAAAADTSGKNRVTADEKIARLLGLLLVKYIKRRPTKCRF